MSIDSVIADAASVAEIFGVLFGAVNVLTLIQSRLNRRETKDVRRVIGTPDPERTRLTEGGTLSEKIERLSDGMHSLQEAFKSHVDKERAREIAHEVSEQPSRGRRVRYDNAGDHE